MTFGSNPFAESVFAGTALVSDVVVVPPGGGPEVPIIIDPFTITISDFSIKPLIDTLSIDLEFGQQGTASFTLVNIVDRDIQIGEPVNIYFYEEQLFAGYVDNLKLTTNNTQTYKTIAVECVDYTSLLLRKKIKQTFINKTPWSIANFAVINYLSGDGVTMGDSPFAIALPTVDANNVSIYDVLYDAAAAVGGTFSIDNNKVINFRDATPIPAPMIIDENIAMDCTVKFDRDTYRNSQVVEVTGTPVGNEAPITVSFTATNHEQVQSRIAIESTNGLYVERESLTHPTSNDPGELLKLATATARLILATNGEIRQTLNITTRQYGFKVGQTATVSIPQLGRIGSWFIHRVSLREISGRWLETTMTLTVTSLRERKQQLWLDMVRKGKVLVIPPTPTLTQSTTYSTPGSYLFTIPAGITTIQVTCKGGGGGGGGPARHQYFSLTPRYGLGGQGGKGGMAISVISVTPGQIYTVDVGAGGAGGAAGDQLNSQANAQGANGELGHASRVTRSGLDYAVAYGGNGGIGAVANSLTNISGIWPPSPDGSGGGTFVTVGGGAIGGVSGNANPPQTSQSGFNGSVMVEW